MRILCLFAVCLLVSGCANLNRPQVSINAIAAPDVGMYKTYVIMAADERWRGLEFDAYVAQIDRALEQKGFIKAAGGMPANVAIALTINVGEPQTVTRSGAMPTWGQTGYSSAHTYGSSYGNQYQANTYYTPKYGVTGYVPYTNSVTYYPIGFALGAWAKAADEKEAHQIWNILVTANSENGDLRSAFPRMLAAAVPYIAGDTRGIIKVTAPPEQ